MLWLYPFLRAFDLSLSHRKMQAEALSLQAPVFDKSVLPLLLLMFAIVTASSSVLWIQLYLSKCHLQPATPHTHILPRELSPLFYMQRVPIKSLLPMAACASMCTASISVSPNVAYRAHCLSHEPSGKKNVCL